MMNPEVVEYFAELAADKLCALQVMDWYTHHQSCVVNSYICNVYMYSIFNYILVYNSIYGTGILFTYNLTYAEKHICV